MYTYLVPKTSFVKNFKWKTKSKIEQISKSTESKGLWNGYRSTKGSNKDREKIKLLSLPSNFTFFFISQTRWQVFWQVMRMILYIYTSVGKKKKKDSPGRSCEVPRKERERGKVKKKKRTRDTTLDRVQCLSLKNWRTRSVDSKRVERFFFYQLQLYIFQWIYYSLPKIYYLYFCFD